MLYRSIIKLFFYLNTMDKVFIDFLQIMVILYLRHSFQTQLCGSLKHIINLLSDLNTLRQ